MSTTLHPALECMPRTAGGHLLLHRYAAIYRMVHYGRRALGFAGTELGPFFERYPFLADSFEDLRRLMPPQITWEAAVGWWGEQILAWESDVRLDLPLRSASRHCGLDVSSRIALVAVGLAEEDGQLGSFVADLQAPTSSRRPTLGLVGRLVANPDGPCAADAWFACQPLLTSGLVEVLDESVPRSEWVLRVPSLLWEFIRAGMAPGTTRKGLFEVMESEAGMQQLDLPRQFVDRLSNVPALLASGKARIVLLRCGPGDDAVEVMAAIAGALGRRLLRLNGNLPQPNSPASLVGPFAALANAMPCLTFEPGPGEVVKLPPIGSYTGPVGLILGREGGLDADLSAMAITLNLPPLDPELRRQRWRRGFGERPVEELDRITESYRFGGALIDQVARLATTNADLDGRNRVTPRDVTEASRTVNRQLLDSLATHVPAHGSWTDFVASSGTREKLLEVERRCRHREDMHGQLGAAFEPETNHGVRALFTGSSGTGKTLAARILAARLGMDLYRVDLASVVNKYIGETEKNLQRVLGRAEALDVVLLLDEGDALMGQRTAVSSANDRYANLETNYLLQRLENYQGIVIVTTNLGDNIDTAFKRRMDVVVPFFPPDAEERLQILSLHLPTKHHIDWTFLERVALQCQFTGGQIRNVAQLVALNALEDDMPPNDRHLMEAAQSEYRKAGGLCPLVTPPARRRDDGDIRGFVEAFMRE